LKATSRARKTATKLKLFLLEAPMASRSNTTFQKRQKELARQEKKREKAEKRAQRKLEKEPQTSSGPPIEPLDPEAFPELTEIGQPTQGRNA
jgi:hypothetical protein